MGVKEGGEGRGGTRVQRERGKKGKSLFPFPGHDMINRFFLI